jgi:hypothetical protein
MHLAGKVFSTEFLNMVLTGKWQLYGELLIPNLLSHFSGFLINLLWVIFDD